MINVRPQFRHFNFPFSVTNTEKQEITLFDESFDARAYGRPTEATNFWRWHVTPSDVCLSFRKQIRELRHIGSNGRKTFIFQKILIWISNANRSGNQQKERNKKTFRREPWARMQSVEMYTYGNCTAQTMTRCCFIDCRLVGWRQWAELCESKWLWTIPTIIRTTPHTPTSYSRQHSIRCRSTMYKLFANILLVQFGWLSDKILEPTPLRRCRMAPKLSVSHCRVLMNFYWFLLLYQTIFRCRLKRPTERH